jgi:hypothetical protein
LYANGDSNSSTREKDRILNEFREKLLNEEEIKKELEKNITLTDEDFNVLIKKDEGIGLKDIIGSIKPNDEEKRLRKEKEDEEKRLKKEREEIEKEAEKIRKEEERIEKERQKSLNDEQKKGKLEEEKKKLDEKKDSLKKQKEENEKKSFSLLESLSNIRGTIKSITGRDDNRDVAEKPIDLTKVGVLEKIYSITDTGVSEEFLYSEEYKNLVNNKTTIQKVDINKESDIPVLYVEEKSIINFSTSDIPEELLSYRRTEENRHIPTIMSNSDLQNIAIRAIEQNNLPVLRGVIEQTKDPDYFIDSGRTLLSFAIEKQKYILVRYLIYNGASINKTDGNLNTPLHISIINQNKDITKLLVENGANINSQNIDGNTPLMLSVINNQDEIAVMLLKKGADFKLKNLSGDDVLDICKKNNKTKMQQYIVDIIRADAENV